MEGRDPAINFIDRVRTHVDHLITRSRCGHRRNKSKASIEIRLIQPGKTLHHTICLSRQILKPILLIELLNPPDAPLAEPTFAVVYNYLLFQTLSPAAKDKFAAAMAYDQDECLNTG